MPDSHCRHASIVTLISCNGRLWNANDERFADYSIGPRSMRLL